MRLFPRIRICGELPQWITSSAKAAYSPRYNREFPMVLWFSTSVIKGKRDWFWTFLHELGHFSIDCATVFTSSGKAQDVQERYEKVWLKWVVCKVPLCLLGRGDYDV
jgi:hypothetical protein